MAKAPRPSIDDGLKPQAALAATDSARTGDWTDVPETQNTISRIPHFSGCAAHGKASRPSIENGLKPQAVLPARAIGRMQRTTLARRVPGGSTATILFPGCATHDKAPRPSIEDGLKPQAVLAARAIGRMQRTTSRTTRARRAPGGSTAMILFPGCATHDKGSASVHW